MARIRSVEMLTQDLRFAGRALLKAPAFSIATTVTLALGIGATTTVFSIFDGVFLRPLNYPNAERLYVAQEILPQLKTPVAGVNALHFKEWRTSARSFDDMALLSGFDANLSGSGDPEQVYAARVSPSLFSVLGVTAQMGRTFLSEEAQRGSDRVVVLTHDLWMRRFAGDAATAGQTISLNGEPHTIVGVLPRGFAVPKLKYLGDRPSVAGQPQLFTPFAMWDEPFLAQMYSFTCIARLRPGVRVSQAYSELNVLQRRIASSAPQRRDLQVKLIPLHEQIVNRSRSGLQLLFAAASLVLAIGCVNIAHLFFVRVGARRRELAVRRALGAGTGRLLWQLLAEGVLIAIGGGILGVAAAYASLRIIQASTAALDLPRLEEASIDLRVLLFAFIAAITTALAATFLPAKSFAATSPAESLRSGSAAAIGTRNRSIIPSVFVGVEVAVTMTSLVAAALLLQSLVRVLEVERGFSDGAVFSTQLNVAHSRYREAHARVRLFDGLLDRVRGVPGVVSAGVASRLPLAGQVGGSVLSVEGTAVPRVDRPIVAPAVTDPAYFQTVGIPIKAGRVFEGVDRDRRLVAVVADAVAERAWPGQNPVGRRFRLGADDAPLVEVVGVAGNVRGVSLTDSATLDVYLPYWQSDLSLYADKYSLVFGPTAGSLVPLSQIRQVIRKVDPELPAGVAQTLDQIADQSVAPRWFQFNLVLALGATTTLLAAIGIYGLIAQSVNLRRTEIGVRIALGAQAHEIRNLILREIVVPVAIGLGVGGAIAILPMSRVLRSLLYGVSTSDPFAIAGSAAVIGTVAVAAAFVPTRRATRLDPAAMLRYE